MGVEKESSKSGGYVGGFFQLFDWKAKSRKKLFSSKSDIPGRSKQGKRSDENLPMTHFHLLDDDDSGLGPFIRGTSDYSCASSMTDEDGYGTKAPGVVARLMGLDSLPIPNFAEPSSTPFVDTQSLRETSQRRRQVEVYHHDQIMYSGHMLHNEDGFSKNFMEPKPQKLTSRPIEKFQTEILPPKSAKTIPVTHHKLLSPIKSPGFIPSKTAAHIMEAAARMIEPSPQVAAKSKVPLVRSSSAPLKVQDLKEKLEAVQKMPIVGSSSMPTKARGVKEKVENAHRNSRSVESSQRKIENNGYNLQSNASKYLRGQPLNKSWNGSVDTTPLRGFTETEEGSSSSKSKGKSISLAVQAKVNVQRREGLSSNSSQGFKSDTISNQPFKSQSNAQKSLHKNFNNGSTVLRQNNQKQNCQKEKDILPLKSALSSFQGRKVASGGPVRHKTSGKAVGSEIGFGKLGSETPNSKREISNNAIRNAPRKKRSIDDNSQSKKSQVVDSGRKAIESNLIVDRHFSFAQESKKEGMDVVSFTFTAPLTRAMPGSETSSPVVLKNSGYCLENRGKRLLLNSGGMKMSSARCDLIRGEDLNVLLEQKLKALSSNVGSSYYNSDKLGTFGSTSSLQNPISNPDAGVTAPSFLDNREPHAMCANKICCSYCSNTLLADDSDVFSTDSTNPAAFGSKHMIQGAGDMEEWGSGTNDLRKQLDHRRPSPVSVLETSFFTESSNSLESTDSSYTEGNKQCSSIQGQEVLGLSSSEKYHCVDTETELSDSASSTSIGIVNGEAKTETQEITLRSTNWEVDYVKQILSNFDWMFRDFTLCRSHEIVSPHLFNKLENRKDMLEINAVESKQERKLLFDCVSECLDSRCTQYLGGGFRAWAKGMSMVTRKDRLLDEAHKEISTWRGLKDCNVDELVYKDMSSWNGRWLEFEVDRHVLGADLESQILNSLVNEVVADMLLSSH